MRLAVASFGSLVFVSVAFAQAHHAGASIAPSAPSAVHAAMASPSPAAAHGSFSSSHSGSGFVNSNPVNSGSGGSHSAPVRIGSSGPIPSHPTHQPSPPPISHLPTSRPIISRPLRLGTTLVPYAVYFGGGYYGGGSGAYASQPAQSYDYGITDAPPAVMNQGYRSDYANPLMQDFSDGPLPESVADEKATIYLLAMSDHTIIAAVGYWVDDDTLSYITTEGSLNRISLSLVDREFSRQLNDSRNVEFKLPPLKLPLN
jgi:hypothetical protein